MNNEGVEQQPTQLSGVAVVGRGVAVWREQRGLTIEQLAQLSGFPSMLLSAIEAGQHDPDIDLLDRLAGVLGIRLIDLLILPS
ncbi:hypothetical protein CXZ10_11235 [Pleomorphomonas diazotrophica]|uniref:HTH cro/C1-type domain-containing protein n=1 Tax=Pleomorphomonas diazotrophica TaxID=1166257 RepID=A0A2N3LWZ5_9HYPH|nr:hypothetical protein CXZ10_11235 [Pleomorphomonas diazotrophica]